MLITNGKLTKIIIRRFLLSNRKMSLNSLNEISESDLDCLTQKLPPILTNERHKGQSGRIGVIGGSLEYTGAPFFSGISALRTGADLIHIFCSRDAAPVIKSYSPELIVHPLLNEQIEKAFPWLENLNVVVIGPGLGRNDDIFANVLKLIDQCRKLQKPLVFDADGLFLLTKHQQILNDYPEQIFLTPNFVEFQRLFNDNKEADVDLHRFGTKCTVVKKGQIDEIFNKNVKSFCTVKGSNRRCGGQGDLLSGSLATFYSWAINNNNIDNKAVVAAYAACKLTRLCNKIAYETHARSATTSDMINVIGKVFQLHFEPDFC